MIAAARRHRTAIKFCGVTSLDDARLAIEAGADAIGVILAPSSRQVNVTTAKRIAEGTPRSLGLVAVVGTDLSVVADLHDVGYRMQFAAPIEASMARRLTGGAPYVRVVHVAPHGDDEIKTVALPGEILLFDTADGEKLGGSARSFRWGRVANVAARRDVVVAGGLDANNVAGCIRTVRPFGVDVRSGIETAGQKSPAKMRAFVCAVREADAALYGS